LHAGFADLGDEIESRKVMLTKFLQDPSLSGGSDEAN
jgi:hypothetical protein